MARLRYVDLSGTVGSGGLTNSATSHTFTAPLVYGNGQTVPTLAGLDYFMLSILNTAGDAVSEVVKVTAYNSGTGAATIVRGQEGTTGVSHTSGDKVLMGAYPSDLGLEFPFTRTYSVDMLDGIFTWLGTEGGTKPYGNPAGMPSTFQPGDLTLNPFAQVSVDVSQSSNIDSARLAREALDRDLSEQGGASHTSADTNAWWKADFRTGHTVTPTRLAIVGRSSGGLHPRSFKLQGSNDDSSWTDLLTVTGAGPNDATFYSTAVTGASAYRYLRIYNTGNNSSGTLYLVLGEVEIWGTMT